MSERVLAVDTTFGACSAALMDGERVLARRWEVMQRGHAEALAPMVAAVMDEAKFGFAALDRLAVTTGPGSFTGQRVGLAFMRGLRIALDKPLVGVTSLAAMAAAAQMETGCSVAAAVHDAKRDEVYLETTAGSGPVVVTIAEAKRRLSIFASLALAGTGAPLVITACPSAQMTTIAAPDAVWVARLAKYSSDTAVRPLYLRPPDAKLPAAI